MADAELGSLQPAELNSLAEGLQGDLQQLSDSAQKLQGAVARFHQSGVALEALEGETEGACASSLPTPPRPAVESTAPPLTRARRRQADARSPHAVSIRAGQAGGHGEGAHRHRHRLLCGGAHPRGRRFSTRGTHGSGAAAGRTAADALLRCCQFTPADGVAFCRRKVLLLRENLDKLGEVRHGGWEEERDARSRRHAWVVALIPLPRLST